MELILRLSALLVAPVLLITGILLWAASGRRTRRLWFTATVIMLGIVLGLTLWQSSYDDPEAPLYAVALIGVLPIAVMAAVTGIAVRYGWSRGVTGILVIMSGTITSLITALWAYSYA